ncbi:MAG: DedA family protein [Betaproteobacteria bacterium]|nr:DedA family protein [Betaproteobacteria bacterium]MDH5220077.1 DedA family protein [Betaproteobacteria bacterium]MDH5351459.1 DedA family protein [Betaproteobacteria bacterium]
MELLAALWDFALHLDAHLAAFVAQHGAWVYALLFVIVFTETGVVVMPFLPGDSLLFVVGALAAAGGMDIVTVMAVLVAAALTGDNCNYWIGRWAGPKVFRMEESRWFSRRHLERTHAFYERYGGQAIIIARFVPIVRTYVPFVAGIGTMSYARFLAFSVAGALLWVVSLCLAGYWFGNIPLVKDNLGVVIVIIIGVSVTPIGLGWLRARRRAAPRIS